MTSLPNKYSNLSRDRKLPQLTPPIKLHDQTRTHTQNFMKDLTPMFFFPFFFFLYIYLVRCCFGKTQSLGQVQVQVQRKLRGCIGKCGSQKGKIKASSSRLTSLASEYIYQSKNNRVVLGLAHCNLERNNYLDIVRVTHNRMHISEKGSYK